MQLCKITGCEHFSKRNPSGDQYDWHLSPSWKEWKICPCCAIELYDMGVIPTKFARSPKCQRELNRQRIISNQTKKPFNLKKLLT